MYREDKGRVYKCLEEAIQGTAYASTQVLDLVEFEKASINMVDSNLRKSTSSNVIFGVKSQKCMTEAADLMCFYSAIGR